jgi:hypothetical protein
MSNLTHTASKEGAGERAGPSDLSDDRVPGDRVKSAYMRRSHVNVWTTLVVLALSFGVSALAFGSGESLDSILGHWRDGLVILVGGAFLFSFTLWFQLALQHRERVIELDHLRQENAILAETIRRRLVQHESRGPGLRD